MFEWKVEEQKLTNENYDVMEHTFYGLRKNTIYKIENELSVSEKYNVIDFFMDGKLKYFDELNKKYIKALKDGTIKKGSWDCAKENSKKAWIRKNDTNNVFWNGKSKDNLWTNDYLNTFGYRSKFYFGYEFTDADINQTFHKLCIELHNKEKKWFREHDEYEILKTEWRDSGCPSFGNNIGNCSDGSIFIYDIDNSRRLITIEELKMLLAQYKRLKEFEIELSKESIIAY